MPKAKTPKGVESALEPDTGVVIPRMRLGEQGVLGLKTSAGRVLEETQRLFRYPDFITTVGEMRNNPTVGAAMNVYRMMISRVKWDVQAPEDGDEKDKARADAVRQMMHDMDHSWDEFVESIIPYLEFGFAVTEKVFRRRLTRNGSKYNDGIVGLKKLAPRAQETICGWLWSQDGSDLVGVEQSLRAIENSIRFVNKTNEKGRLEIPRDKFLLFTASPTKGNPEGNSIYKNIYLAFKQLSLLQDQELIGVAKDVQGILKIEIPPRYLDPNATASEKAVLASFQQIIDNYNAGTQRGLLVPNMIDPDAKLTLFNYSLMESKGSAKYDTESIIRRLQGDILSALSVDVLQLGSEGSGSFSLAETKSSILALAIDYRLKEIKGTLNSDLMRQIYALNGWQSEKMAKFVYEDVETIDVETFSKAIQRVFSTSAIEMDRDVMNRVREMLGIPLRPADEEVDKEKLPATVSGAVSSAGKGMEVGTSGDGTSKSGSSGQNRSDNNSDNNG